MTRLFHKWLILATFVVNGAQANAQVIRIGNVENRESELKRIVAIDTTTFYAFSREWTSIRSYFSLKQYGNLEVQHRTDLPTQLDGDPIDYKDFALINDTLSVFFCVPRGRDYYYYLQQYDPLCTAIGEPKLLVAYPRMSNKKWSNGNIIFSEDRSQYLIYLEVEDKTEKSRSVEYTVFSANHEVKRQGTLQSTKDAADVRFSAIWLTASDAVIVSESVLFKRMWYERKGNRRMDHVNLHVLRETDNVTLTLVPQEDDYLTQVECVLNSDNTLSGMGIYCKQDDHFHGLFTFSAAVDHSQEIVVNTRKRAESLELLELDLQYKAQKTGKSQTVRNRNYTCNEMKLRGIHKIADSTVFVWERFYVLVNKSTASYGAKDLLFVKTHLDSVVNITTVSKARYSFNDGGISLPTLVQRSSENKLICYFNDAPDNYNAQGMYAEAAKILPRQSEESSLIALEYDLQTDSYQRMQLFDPTVFELPAVPQMWIQVQQDYFLMYFASFTKTRYALWKFR